MYISNDIIVIPAFVDTCWAR